MRGTWIIAIALASLLSGCLFAGTPEFKPGVWTDDAYYTLDLPIHIVAVGFERFDAAALLPKIKAPEQPFLMIRADSTGDNSLEPLRYNVQYKVHEAPASFAEELFAYAATISKPQSPDGFLRNYDRAGPARICPPREAPVATLPVAGSVGGSNPPCPDIQTIDAAKLEAWIHENRARHGVEYPGAGYTVFVLDSYTKGYLAKENYHQYWIEDGTIDSSLLNQRAWGGSHDFVFLDVGAAPSGYDIKPWRNYSRADPVSEKLANQEDRPIWDYTSDMGTFYDNLAQNIYDATRILWARKPIYPFEYAEKYVLPMYVFVDGAAHANPDSPLARFDYADVKKNTDAAVVLKAFQDLTPWAAVELQLKFVYLPDDDPALQAAVLDAKSRYSGQSVDFGVLKKYFRENWDKYVPQVDGARVYPTFAFWFDVPSNGLFAYSDGDELGRSWGVFFNVADAMLCLRPAKPVCFVEEFFADEKSWWGWWNGVLIHELGHSYGLTHPHDTSNLDEKGYTTYDVNWLWDSTSSIMTYRHVLPQFNEFDRDLLYRAHTVNLARLVLETPGTSEAVRADAQRALDSLPAGDYQASFEAARAALRLSGLDPFEPWDLGKAGTPVTQRIRIPGSFSPAGSAPMPIGLPLPAPKYPDQAEPARRASIPLEIADGAQAVLVEYREAPQAAHPKWAVSVSIVNADGEQVLTLGNNAYDKGVLLNLDRCSAGCQVLFIARSGMNLEYDVTTTSYFPGA